MNAWEELFSPSGFGFRLTLRRGDPAAFFAPTAAAREILPERRRWLEESPEEYAIFTEPAQDAWDEFRRLASGWIDQPVAADPVIAGGQLEPDVLLLTRDENGTFRLQGGVVVFPSHWALAPKMGQTLLEIHGVVPGLNDAIGPAIDRYLDKLKPGFAAGRPNWGLAATDAYNLHPKVAPPRLMSGMSASDIWLRIENQILSPLPETGAILFGIRIERIRLTEVLQDPVVRRNFHQTIQTMPVEVAAYKGLSEIGPDLLKISA